MKQGDTIEIVIESIGGGGEGLARCGGHTVVVPFALTGEKAAAKVVYVKRDGTVFARLKNIEKPSADKVTPAALSEKGTWRVHPVCRRFFYVF